MNKTTIRKEDALKAYVIEPLIYNNQEEKDWEIVLMTKLCAFKENVPVIHRRYLEKIKS